MEKRKFLLLFFLCALFSFQYVRAESAGRKGILSQFPNGYKLNGKAVFCGSDKEKDFIWKVLHTMSGPQEVIEASPRFGAKFILEVSGEKPQRLTIHAMFYGTYFKGVFDNRGILRPASGYKKALSEEELAGLSKCSAESAKNVLRALKIETDENLALKVPHTAKKP